LSSFPDLPVHPSLAAALAARGYETATPVQAAVLEAELAGRDLLVSSQTGSGKTVAFGSLIADTLLADGAKGGPAPRALVVAPTRELGAQVGRELEWLFAKTRARIGTFTGGTSLGLDLRRLRTGVDLAVGTPGRLVDLHKRGALDLSAIQVLVLDEADEMLDLGFKEDLEYLLGQAPAERRTLLFSATLPREIQKLAATFQRDAARIAPEREGSAHSDIRHMAHLVRHQDRLAAVVNVLLAAGDAKAIVFCRTREGVGELHHRLLDLGFKATAISGERAQGERDRAIEAIREGRIRVLVATNVAARGLDLPDLDLVVHGDLPENAESLTHRSGRTGRAGKKGTSLVIADLAERRKAERLFYAAGLQVRWTPAPTAAEVRTALEERLQATLVAEAENVERPAFADRLRKTLSDDVLLNVLLARELARLPGGLPLEPVDVDRRPAASAMAARGRPGADGPPRGRHAADGPPRGRSGDDGPPRERGWEKAVIFRVNLGVDAKAEPGWLLPLICRRGGVTRREIGAIRVGASSSTFEIAAHAAGDFAQAASRSDPKAPHVMIVPVEGARPKAAAHKKAPLAPKRPYKKASSSGDSRS
jgi:ATP-dependent RNA helicase DeaD